MKKLNVYCVEYAVLGSRCTGLYLVHTESEEKATKIIEDNINEVKVTTVEELSSTDLNDHNNDLMGCHVSDLVSDREMEEVLSKEDHYVYLVSGS